MDSPKSSNTQSSLDSLRTVEFRQTLRGYHIDDVDEYLERVAIEAEALQEQMRQSGDRMRQATERIAQLEQAAQQLEQQLEQAHAQPQSSTAAPDDALQRTLLLAQKFVDQTEAEAEAQARKTLTDAEERARKTLADAESQARTLTEETERHLREDVSRLESMRTQLAGDVETIARHLETERNRLRSALGDMLSWVDEHVQPAASLLAQPSTSASSTPSLGATASPSSSDAGSGDNLSGPSPRPAAAGQTPGGPVVSPGSRMSDDPSPGQRQGMMPMAEAEDVRAGVPH